MIATRYIPHYSRSFNGCSGKRLLLLLLLAGMGLLQPTTGRAQETRQRLNFNRDWKFAIGDHEAAAAPAFNDSNWASIGLPHSFSIPYFLSTDFYTGYGWYRKHFTVPAAGLKKQVFLEFEGVFQVAEVFVNGKRVGEHRGGYTGFSLNISEAIHAGDNLVAVRVNNLWDAQLAPRGGEHVFSGGIYRDAYLVMTEPVHMTWCGTFVTTPTVSKQAATIAVSSEINNSDTRAQAVRIKTDIVDTGGKIVSSFSAFRTLGAGETATVSQLSPVVRNPALWHPDHPYLYTAVTSLYIGARKVDQYSTVFGIRSIRWTSKQGFFLNGEHLYFLGANVHQDHAGWGDAVTDTAFFRDVRLVKEAGFNFIRGSHYPHDPAFYAACDRLGILLWSENPFWGTGGGDQAPDGYWNASAYPIHEEDRAPFEASVRQELREMIRINRNHPSVVVWSMSNEPFFTAPQTVPYMRRLLKELVGISHACDSTRPAAIGGAQRPLDSNRIDKLGDVAGYNGDGGVIDIFQDPGLPNAVSEYNHPSSDRPGNYDPGWGDLSKDSGKAVHDWRSGQVIWCAFDHGSIFGSGIGRMGIVDYFRIPKKGWYWYRNQYRHIPPPAWPQPGTPAALRLEADRLTAGTDGKEDVQLKITVLDAAGKPISNSPPVELAIVSGPGEFPTGRKIPFAENSDIRIQDGQAAIECRSQQAGQTIIRASSPGLQPAELRLNFTGGPVYREGVTPPVTDRPYTRFTRVKETKLQSFGLNNPAFASSSAAQHLPGYAADGDPGTWWQPEASDTAAWWLLQTEKRLAVHEINIRFPSKAVYQYIVELSEDGNNWKTVADVTNNATQEDERKITLPGTTGGNLRIRFTNPGMARLAEVTITGRVL